MQKKIVYLELSTIDNHEQRHLISGIEASALPDLLRMVLSEEEVRIYQLHRSKMSLSKIGAALGQDRAKIYRKLCFIKANVRFLLKIKQAIKKLPRLIHDLCPPECPFKE